MEEAKQYSPPLLNMKFPPQEDRRPNSPKRNFVFVAAWMATFKAVVLLTSSEKAGEGAARCPSGRKLTKGPQKLRSRTEVTVFLMLLYSVTWAAGDRHIGKGGALES